MHTRDAILLTGICALTADKKIKAQELKTLSALMSLNKLYEKIINFRNYISKLSKQYEKSDTEQIIEEVSQSLSPKMKETAYAWACALIISDSGMAQAEHVYLKLVVKKFKLNGKLAGRIAAIAPMISRKE